MDDLEILHHFSILAWLWKSIWFSESGTFLKRRHCQRWTPANSGIKIHENQQNPNGKNLVFDRKQPLEAICT
jgi:hypothetical protein